MIRLFPAVVPKRKSLTISIVLICKFVELLRSNSR